MAIHYLEGCIEAADPYEGRADCSGYAVLKDVYGNALCYDLIGVYGDRQDAYDAAQLHSAAYSGIYTVRSLAWVALQSQSMYDRGLLKAKGE